MKIKLAHLAAGVAVVSHFAVAEVPSYEVINEAQFGTGDSKEVLRLKFADGKTIAIDSCSNYLTALRNHGRAREFDGGQQNINSAMVNLPLCEARDYLDANKLHALPGQAVITPQLLPAGVYWAFNHERQSFAKSLPDTANLSEAEKGIVKNGDEKYSAEGINYQLTNLGQIDPDKIIVQISNTLDGGSIFYSRLFILSTKNTPWSVKKEFSFFSE